MQKFIYFYIHHAKTPQLKLLNTIYVSNFVLMHVEENWPGIKNANSNFN